MKLLYLCVKIIGDTQVLILHVHVSPFETWKVIHDSNLILIPKLCHQLSFVVYCSTDNHIHCLRGRLTHILRWVDEFIANRVPRYPRTCELCDFVFLIYYFIFFVICFSFLFNFFFFHRTCTDSSFLP